MSNLTMNIRLINVSYDIFIKLINIANNNKCLARPDRIIHAYSESKEENYKNLNISLNKYERETANYYGHSSHNYKILKQQILFGLINHENIIKCLFNNAGNTWNFT